MRRTLLSVCVPILLVLSTGGCGGSKDANLAPFTGTVTYNGRPVPDATITIQPEKGAIASAITNAEGKFVAKTGKSEGVAVGNCTITVEAWLGGSRDSGAPTVSESDAKNNPNYMNDMMKKAMMNAKKVKPKSLIPIKYAKVDTTPLKNVEIPSSGQKDYEIKLTD